jgi:membrane fusion protein, multidrug efflux system
LEKGSVKSMGERLTRPLRRVMLGTMLLATGACGGGDAAPQAGAQGGGGGRGTMSGRPVLVDVAPVERGDIARQVTVTGTVEPIRVIGVNSQLAGALTAVHVQEGDRVRPGSVLARMDDREQRAQLSAARAALEVAEAAYRRAEQLRERQVITLPEYERDRTAYMAAAAQVEQIETRLSHATITSPIAGIITEKRVETGDIAGNQTRLFTIADISTMVVRVGVSELDVVAIGVGDGVAVALDALPGSTLRGRVRRIFPSADPATRLVPVEVALEGADAAAARPGFLARTTFGVGARSNVMLVPAAAVLPTTGGQAVFVLDNDRAVRRTVETGATHAGRVEIIAGLMDGEFVITTGNNMLRDGATIRVAGREAAPPPRPVVGEGSGG